MASSEQNCSAEPDDMPECLVNLCIQFCVRRPDCIAQYDRNLDGYLLHQNINLPDNLSQLLFEAIICSHTRHHLEKTQQLLFIFKNPLQARLQRVNVQNLHISNDHMKILLAHQPLLLNLKGCQGLSSGWSEALTDCGGNLTSLSLGTTHFLRFQGSRPIADCSHIGQHAGRVVYSELEPNTEGEVLPVKCPNLRRLSLCGDPKYFCVSPPTLATVILRIIQNLKLLSHLEFTGCKVDILRMGALSDLKHLQFLGLHGVPLPNICSVIDVIGEIKSLRGLDLSNASKSHVQYKDLCGPHPHVENILSCLPKLVWLDMSGTDLPLTQSEGEDSATDANLGSFGSLGKRQFDFLGLLDCPNSPSHWPDIPAQKVTGDGNEEQVLLALNMYCDNPGLLWVALCSTFNMCRFVGIRNKRKLVQALLAGLKSPHRSLRCQTICLMTIVQVRKDTFQAETPKSSSLDRKVVSAVFNCIQECFYCEDLAAASTLVKKAILVLMFFEVPEDFMFCYEEASAVLLNLVTREPLVGNMEPQCLYLLKRLASQVDPSQKELMGRIGVQTMLELISSKAKQGESDQAMEIAWSVIWSLTDVCPQNCERFLAEGGMDAFQMCFQKFYPSNMSLMKKMVGMMCNIAEVDYLRTPLMTEEYISCFSSLLDEELNISNSVCGVLAYLVAEGAEAWHIETPSREEVMNHMFTTVFSWDLTSKRNVRYRTFVPILKLISCYDSAAAQLWAAWEICNMVNKDPTRYCPMIEAEAGESLQQVVSDSRTQPKAKEYLQQIMANCQGYGQVQL